MEKNEYVFNYDEVKRRFESVPQTNLITKKFKSTTTYKTYFQPRTKSILNKNDIHSNISRFPRQEKISIIPKMTVQMHIVRIQQIMPIEQFSLQTQQGFYIMPNLIK